MCLIQLSLFDIIYGQKSFNNIIKDMMLWFFYVMMVAKNTAKIL